MEVSIFVSEYDFIADTQKAVLPPTGQNYSETLM